MKENNNGNDTNVGSKGNSIEENIKIALDKFSDNKDSNSAVLIVEQFILGNYVLVGGRKDIVKNSLRYILSDYKRVLKENEEKDELIEKLRTKLKLVDDYNHWVQLAVDRRLELEKTYKELEENYIPVQKIKVIIDRIDYDIKKTKEIISNGRRNDYQITRLKAMNTKSLDIKKRLQKLLESEE